MKSGVLLVLAVVTALCVPPAAAQETEVIHFQGMLTGPDGGPLRTDTYNVNFSIWDHATDDFDPLWSETQTVEVNEGLFDVFLGDGNPLSPDVFTPDEGESELRFLEIQVEGDDPMTPRLQMGKIPNSFVSSRVLGDIETAPSFLLIRDTEADSAIALDAGGGEKGIIVINNRPDAGAGNIGLNSGVEETGIIINDNKADGSSSSIDMMTGGSEKGIIIINSRPDATAGSIGLTSGLEETGIIIINNQPDGNSSSIDMNTGGSEKGIIIINSRPDATAGSIGLNSDLEETGIIIINNKPDGSSSSIDMQTGEGSRMIIDDNMPEGDRAVEIGANQDDAYLSLHLTDTYVPVMDIRGNVSGTSFEMSGYETGQQIGPLLGMNTNAVGANFAMTAPGMGGAGAEIIDPIIEMITDASGGNFRINWAEPLDMPSPAIEMSTNGTNNNITINWAEPLDMPSPAIEMSTAPTTGATYRMFQPQPEPPGQPIIEFNTGIEGGGSIRMFQPQPEPPGSDPIIEMLVGAGGGNFMMYGQQAGLTSTPFFEINSYSSGADMKFFDSGGGTTVAINSGGDVIAQRGTFGQNNTNNGTAGFVSGGNNSLYASYSAIVGGYGNSVATAAEYSCLVGIDATLSADSTFMVDMPHIRFGDETDGYEFPTEDGRPNQMLATDGNGQLSWIDVTLLADENTNRLIEENRELKNMINRLERRVAELENKVR